MIDREGVVVVPLRVVQLIILVAIGVSLLEWAVLGATAMAASAKLLLWPPLVTVLFLFVYVVAQTQLPETGDRR